MYVPHILKTNLDLFSYDKIREIKVKIFILIFQFQQLSRGLESRDYNLLISNMSYVSKWSMIQMLIVIVCGVVQVYFVKKLFADPTQGQGKSKARI